MPAIADPVRESFRRRAIGAVERIAREAAYENIWEALSASTDIGTLARAISDDAASDAVRRLEPLAGAIARGAEVQARLVEAAGGLLSAESVGTLLGIGRAAVDKRRASHRILAVRLRGDWNYPSIQFQDGEVLDFIPDIIGRMADTSPWSTMDFLLSPDDALDGRTPLAALHAGDIATVRRLIAAHEADVFA